MSSETNESQYTKQKETHIDIKEGLDKNSLKSVTKRGSETERDRGRQREREKQKQREVGRETSS